MVIVLSSSVIISALFVRLEHELVVIPEVVADSYADQNASNVFHLISLSLGHEVLV